MSAWAAPTTVTSPIHQFLAQGRKLLPDVGIQWRQTGDLEPAVEAHARTAFQGWTHGQVKKLCDIMDVD